MNDDSTQQDRLVKPLTLKGFCDYLPEEMISRNRIIDKIREVYERYGFAPIDTPILEYLVTLIGTGGEEINKEIFRLESPEREPAGMRFDLTVPFARILAQYNEKIRLPFRRYHIGPVFRADKPGPGRLRQFTQFDIDAAGSDSVIVDAEIVAAMCDVMRELGLTNDDATPDGRLEYRINVNSRGLMEALLASCDISEEETKKHVLRVIDKLHKVGIDDVSKELGEGRIDDSGDPIPGVGLGADLIDLILEFIAISGATRFSILDTIRGMLPDTDSVRVAVDSMEEMAAALESMGVAENEAIFQTSLARGLDYYTGPVFEAVFLDAPQVGSVMGGGRYDRLVERFMPSPIPSTGVSIGIERLIAGLALIGKVKTRSSTTKVLVVAMRNVPVHEQLNVVRELRASRIPSELYLGEPGATVSQQLAYANEKGVPVAILLGPDEIESDTVAIKDLIVGKKERSDVEDREQFRSLGRVGQVSVARQDMIATLHRMLGEEK